MLLLVNACVRKESRTFPLAYKAARKLSSEIDTVNLYEQQIVPISGKTLEKRERFIDRGDYSDDMFRFAKQFRAADQIVIAAPYWDLSFPSVLKCYTEMICVNGLTFRFESDGTPVGLCRADKLVYVTTAGGNIRDNNYGYDYICRLCTFFFGIPNTFCIKAEGLDVIGADTDSIMIEAEHQIDQLII